jgi:hypothetical protein
LFSGQQIERLVIAALREVTLDEAMDRADNLTEQPGDIVGPWRRPRMNCTVPSGPAAKAAVGEHGVDVAVRLNSEPKRYTKVMAPACGSAMRWARARCRCQANYLARNTPRAWLNSSLSRAEQKPHSTRQRQYPLSIGHEGKYAVDEIGRGVCHSTTRARRAESAGLARERHQSLLGARVATYAHESMA